MSIFRKRFKSAKCKALLKLVIIRISIARKKHEIQLKHMRQDVCRFLQIGQAENAQTRVVCVIREQNVIDAFNMLESFCEHIIKQMSVLRAQKTCPASLLEAVSSLLFAGPRCAKLPELLKIRNVFAAKYGKDFVTAAVEPDNSSGVNREIIEKLSSSTSMKEEKIKHIMQDIALEYGIKWDPIALEPELVREHIDCEETKHSKCTITNSITETVLPISRSESVQLISSLQVQESFSLPLSSSNEDEQNAHFDGKNQFIVSVMQIRTLVPSHCEVNSSTVILQDQRHSSRRTCQKQQQEIVGKPHVSFMEEVKPFKTGMEGHVPYRDVVSAAEAAAISADHAAAAAKTAARLAINALSQKRPHAEAETGIKEGDLIHGRAEEAIESDFVIPVQSRMFCPAKLVVHTTSSLSRDRVCNKSSSGPIMDFGRRNNSSDEKQTINDDGNLANEGSPNQKYNTGIILPLGTDSHRADQHREWITSSKPFEVGSRCHGFILHPGPKEVTNGSHPVLNSNECDYQRSQASKSAGAEEPAGLIQPCRVNGQFHNSKWNVSKEKAFQDICIEHTRRQENTKIHPVTSIPGIILSKKRSNRPHIYQRMHSCLLGWSPHDQTGYHDDRAI